MKRRTLIAAGATLLAAPRLALAQASRVLRVVPQADLAILDPGITTATVTRNHAFMVFDTLYGLTADGRPVPKTDEDRAKALRTMISYSGRYRVEDGKVITKVEVAWNEAWVGGEQVRFIRFEGDDLLHIESPPMPHPNVNEKVVRVIVSWARDKS